ncbi:MAG: DNA-binding protein [Nanoarchaeota archaeon]|nr:DNA-binding protein [Nanoarchaeota archaeon]
MMTQQPIREEVVIILDFLPHGYPFDSRPMHQKTPIVQALGKNHFTLLELVPKKEVFLQPYEEVYIGEGKRDKIHHIIGRLSMDKLTQTAKMELNEVLSNVVSKNEEKFVEFFNKAGPINTRRHQIELLPGVGKKHMWEIIEARKEEEFKNLEDVKKRVKLMPDPKNVIIKRIIMELNNEDKYKLFSGV